MSHLKVLALSISLALAGCGGEAENFNTNNDANSDTNIVDQQDYSNDIKQLAQAPNYGVSPWTTLGNRGHLAEPGKVITSNADATWQDYDPPYLYEGYKTFPMSYLTLRDGMQLAVFVSLPTDAKGNVIDKQFPTILQQTPYNGSMGNTLNDIGLGSLGALVGSTDPYFVRHGYAMVSVDVRGTGQSDGLWQSFGEEEQQDYAEVVNWITDQSWSNGDVALYGVSYLGITTMLTASQNLPQVKAAFPIVPIGDGYRDSVFTGGQANALFTPLWFTIVGGLSLLQPCAIIEPDPACITRAFQHFDNVASKFQVPMLMGALGGDEDTTFDGTSTEAFWAIRSPLEHIHKIRVPTFIVGGLHDLFQRSEPLAYETMKLNTTTKLLMGPWNHLEAAVGKGLPSKEGIPRLNQIALQWFDQYVKGEDVAADKLPNVTQYVKGADKYITSTDWPLPEAKAVTLYMHNRGELKETVPSKRAASKQYLNTPLGGLCSMSASQWTFGALGMIPLPCYTENNLADLSSLVYETPVLEEGMYINGPIIANVWISSNAKDAQVSVRVSDVHPNGKAMALTNGIHTASLRAVDESRSRYLDGVMIQPWHPYTKEAKQPLEKGAPTLVPVEIFPTSAWIAPGHKLRVSVGSGNLGQGLPPLPTLLEMYDWTLHTKLYNEADFPSHVVLPVVPEQVLQ